MQAPPNPLHLTAARLRFGINDEDLQQNHTLSVRPVGGGPAASWTLLNRPLLSESGEFLLAQTCHRHQYLFGMLAMRGRGPHTAS